jgi:hypothetical protein
MQQYFEFEKLDVYQTALEFAVVADEIVEALPPGRSYLRDQLRRAADFGLGLGNGNGNGRARRSRRIGTFPRRLRLRVTNGERHQRDEGGQLLTAMGVPPAGAQGSECPSG